MRNILCFYVATLVLACAGPSDDHAAGTSTASDTLVAAVSLRIGHSEGTEESLFGQVTSVAVGNDGLIYVADRIGSSVRVFSGTGEFLAWVGKEGSGPGEFRWPDDLLPTEDGRLVVRDLRRITTFARSAASLFPDSVVSTWQLPGVSLRSRRARFVDSIYFHPSFTYPDDVPIRYNYRLFAPNGFDGDTVWVPPLANLSGGRTAFFRFPAGDGRMVDGLSQAPFGPQATWIVTARGTFITAEGASDELFEYNRDGSAIRSINGPTAFARAIPPAERADTLAALQRRIDFLPVPLEDVQNVSPEVLSGNHADTLPSVIGLFSDTEDRLWVQRWPAEGHGASRVFDLLDMSGNHLFTVLVNAPLLSDPPPFFGAKFVAGVVRDPVTDVEPVVIVRFGDANP